MRTAIDTNILPAIWSNEAQAAALSEQLFQLSRDGALLICPIVFVELSAHPHSTRSFIEEFLRRVKITVDYTMHPSVWSEAADRFSQHTTRRRQAGQREAKRVPADFVIGAHALLQADRLITRDQGRYSQDFPELQLV